MDLVIFLLELAFIDSLLNATQGVKCYIWANHLIFTTTQTILRIPQETEIPAPAPL